MIKKRVGQCSRLKECVKIEPSNQRNLIEDLIMLWYHNKPLKRKRRKRLRNQIKRSKIRKKRFDETLGKFSLMTPVEFFHYKFLLSEQKFVFIYLPISIQFMYSKSSLKNLPVKK